jgi:hypothetical protein
MFSPWTRHPRLNPRVLLLLSSRTLPLSLEAPGGKWERRLAAAKDDILLIL